MLFTRYFIYASLSGINSVGGIQTAAFSNSNDRNTAEK